MTTTHTKEEKSAYFARLRADWNKSKELAKTEAMQAIFREASLTGIKVSNTGFAFIYAQMRGQELEGLPVVDAKTFDGWKQSGFKVKKGEHSKLSGITWISPVNKQTKEEEDFAYPKSYNLFHRSQVEAIA